jgi:hypothetical protein
VVAVNRRIEDDKLYVGVIFAHQSHDEIKSKVMLVFGNSDRWWQFQKRRTSKQGIGRNMIFFVRTGYHAAVAHFVALLRLFVKNLVAVIKTRFKLFIGGQVLKE